MKTCWDCGTKLFAGALFCQECGADLMQAEDDREARHTIPAFGSEIERRPSPPLQLVGQEIAPQRDVRSIQVVVATTGRRQTLMLDEQILVGRADPAAGVAPALDLTADRGAELGVSRRHAIIRQTEEGPAVLDLESTNGTLLNGQRLPPELPYRLSHGDEMQFGDVVVHVFFDRKSG